MIFRISFPTRAAAALALIIGSVIVHSGAGSAAPAVQHRFFGLLQRSQGALVTIRLRNGRLMAVDATPAYALGRVSAPLYAGKPTVVEGTFEANGMLRATIVKRAAPRMASWGLDQ